MSREMNTKSKVTTAKLLKANIVCKVELRGLEFPVEGFHLVAPGIIIQNDKN